MLRSAKKSPRIGAKLKSRQLNTFVPQDFPADLKLFRKLNSMVILLYPSGRGNRSAPKEFDGTRPSPPSSP